MREHEPVSEAVIRLILERVLPDLGLAELASRTEMFFVGGDEFNATVRRDDRFEDARYGIEIDHRVPEAVIEALRSVSDDEGAMGTIDLETASRLGLRDEEAYLNLILVASTGFVVLHELTHIVGGHMRCWGEHYESGEGEVFDELSHFGLAGDEQIGPEASQFRRCAELEADGCAVELLHKFRVEFGSVLTSGGLVDELGEEEVLPEAEDACLSRALLTGALIAIALIEKERGTPEEGRAHPFPETRRLNAMSRFLTEPLDSFRHISGGEERVSYKDPAAETALLGAMGTVVLPSQMVAAAAVPLDGEWQLSSEPNAFTRDLVSLVATGAGSDSIGGGQLSALTREKTAFARRLHDYREVDWWARARF